MNMDNFGFVAAQLLGLVPERDRYREERDELDELQALIRERIRNRRRLVNRDFIERLVEEIRARRRGWQSPLPRTPGTVERRAVVTPARPVRRIVYEFE